MKKMNRFFALLMALLLLTVLLSGCASKQCVWCGKSFSGAGHDTGTGIVCDDCYNSLSGGAATKSNTGVWIAVTVMVFIAVFSATSGVVYLVLQRVLPPEDLAPRSRRSQQRDFDYDDFQESRPVVPKPAPRAPAPKPAVTDGVWICPRDKSRNTGPYCAVCGSNRPAAPQRSQPIQPEYRSSRSVVRPNGQDAPAFARPQQPTAARPQQPTPRPQQQAPIPQRKAQTEDWQLTPEAPETEYRGKFARRESPQEPEEVDSELLAAIFREAAEGSKEE